MKKLTLLTTFILLAISCFSQSNDFKFKGELPEGKFIILKLEDGGKNLQRIDGDTIALRNRVYIIVDSLANILLNGHASPHGSFQNDLKYILTNPEKHDHLPEDIEKAYFFSNILDRAYTSNMDQVVVFKKEHIGYSLRKVYYELMLEYMESSLNKNWETIDTSDVNVLTEKFHIKMAVHEDSSESSLAIKLPPWTEEPELSEEQMKSRNVLTVLVNANNNILVRGNYSELKELRATAKEFIMNPNGLLELAESPKEAIISLKNDRGTKYELYLKVYNELKAAYNELWDEAAQKQFGKKYEELSFSEKKEIKKEIPFVISEAEPSKF